MHRGLLAGGHPVALAGLDLALRQCCFRDLRRILEDLVNAAAVADETVPPPGHKRHAQRERTIETMFGPITYRRDYLYDPTTGEGQFPFDRQLGLVGSTTAPLAKILTHAAAQTGFAAASANLRLYADLEIGARKIHRLVQSLGVPAEAWLRGHAERLPPTAPIPVFYIEADGTGVPMRSAELADRRGRQPDGTAKTREVKVGACFTQQTWDQKTGEPWRDLHSTTYVASFEPAETFGALLGREASRRGIGRATQQVFLSDGAAWAATIARTQFPQALHIVDFYHANEHAHALAKCLQPAAHAELAAQWKTLLFEHPDGVANLLAQARMRLPAEPERLAVAMEEIGYFENNGSHMKYASYRQRHFFIGSGVIEAACKTLIGQRFKRSGMFWSMPGATRLLPFRCAMESKRFDQLWIGLAPSLQAAA